MKHEMYCFITPTNTIVFHTQGLISLVTFNNTRKMYPINSLLTIYCHLQRVCISLIYQLQRHKLGVILIRYWLLCLLFYVHRNKLILLNRTSAWYFYSSNNQHLIVLCLCPPTLLLDIAKQTLSYHEWSFSLCPCARYSPACVQRTWTVWGRHRTPGIDVPSPSGRSPRRRVSA